MENIQFAPASPRQIRFLEARGFQHAETWSFGDAKSMIDRIAENGWRVPPGIVPAEYEPAGNGGSGMNQLKTMKIGSREHPVEGYIETKQVGTVPLVDIPMMSDYKWQLRSLRSRMESPEMYREALGEDVAAVIAMLRNWLGVHSEEATPAEREEAAQLLAVCP